MIGTPLITGDSSDAQKEEVELKLGGGARGALFVRHLCSLCCVPLPRASAWLTASQSSPRSVWPATWNSRLPSSALFPPVYLHANSLFTEYAPPPLAMNSGQGPHQRANYHLPTKQLKFGRNAAGVQHWDHSVGQMFSGGPGRAWNKDLALKSTS